MLKPEKINQSYTRLSCRLKSQSVVECRFPQSAGMMEILAVHPQVNLVSCEVSSGRVNYGGRLILTVVYADEEGKLCRMQKGAEFSHYADDDSLAPAQTANCALLCERAQVKRDGSAFVVSAVIGAEIAVFARSERSFISDGDGAFFRKESAVLLSAVPFSGESEIEDEFDADSVADVLVPQAKALVTSCECGTGEIIVGGEIYLSLLAMRGETPASIDRVISFKSVIPCDDSEAGRRAQVAAEINGLNVTATVNEERGKCVISFVGSLAFSGVFYSRTETEVVTDAFSVRKELALTFAEESASPCQDVRVYTERVSGQATSKSKLDYTCVFKAAALPGAEYEFIRESGAVEGSVNALLVYEQNGEIKSSEIRLPFAVVLNGAVAENQTVAADVAVCGISVRQRAEGELEAEAVLKISATITQNETCRYLTDAEEGEDVPYSDSAISVYIPAAGDGLWDTAKKLRWSPDEVTVCNPELNYPLTGNERILIYRGKTNREKSL